MKALSDGKVQTIGIGVRVLLAGALLAIGLAPAAWANTYTYTYTGNPLTSCSGPGCITSAPYPVITASFTVASPLGANSAYAPVTFVSYSITDGSGLVLTNLNSTLETSLEVATTGGAITQWNFYAEILSPTQNVQFYTVSFSGGFPEDSAYNLNLVSGLASVNNADFYDAGTWTSSAGATPEAPTLLLLGTGLLGLGTLVLRGEQIG